MQIFHLTLTKCKSVLLQEPLQAALLKLLSFECKKNNKFDLFHFATVVFLFFSLSLQKFMHKTEIHNISVRIVRLLTRLSWWFVEFKLRWFIVSFRLLISTILSFVTQWNELYYFSASQAHRYRRRDKIVIRVSSFKPKATSSYSAGTSKRFGKRCI